MLRTVANLLLLLPFAACAQQPLILLDPARGGANSGAQIANRVPEKQVTLELADRLASLLRARGFDVSMTRNSDVDVSSDARAALANNTHPLACILLYAAPGGSGVHLYTTAQKQAAAAGSAVRWDEAQAPYADRSHTLAYDLRSSLEEAKITASAGQTWMRPLDNMQCPAVAVELLPDKNGKGAEDSSYQGHVANAIANTLLQWRGKVAATAPQAAPAAPPAPAKPAVPSGGSATAQPGDTTAPGEGSAPRPATQAAPPAGSSSSTTPPRKQVAPPKPVQPAPVVREPADPADRTEP